MGSFRDFVDWCTCHAAGDGHIRYALRNLTSQALGASKRREAKSDFKGHPQALIVSYCPLINLTGCF